RVAREQPRPDMCWEMLERGLTDRERTLAEHPWRSFDRWKDAASKGEWAPARPRCLPTSRARLAHRELVGQRARHVRAGALTRLDVAFRQQLLIGRDERYARDAELF